MASVRNPTVGRAAKKAIKNRVGKIRKKLPAAAKRADEDVEHVHQLRVASRRSGAALRLFRDLLPKKSAARLGRELKRVRNAAGEARDLDVLIARLTDEGACPDILLAELAEQRRRAQPAIRRICKRLEKGEKLQQICRRALRKSDKTGLWREPLAPWARRRITELLERLAAAAPAEPVAEALHQFRISAKRLRYAIEILADALPPGYADEVLPRLKGLQDRLGALNDHASAAERFSDWRRSDSRAQAAAMADGERTALHAAVADFWGWFEADRDPFLQSLREPLERSLPVHV